MGYHSFANWRRNHPHGVYVHVHLSGEIAFRILIYIWITKLYGTPNKIHLSITGYDDLYKRYIVWQSYAWWVKWCDSKRQFHLNTPIHGFVTLSIITHWNNVRSTLLFDGLFTTSKLRVDELFRGKSKLAAGWPVNSSHKGPVMRKTSTCDRVKHFLSHTLCVTLTHGKHPSWWLSLGTQVCIPVDWLN